MIREHDVLNITFYYIMLFHYIEFHYIKFHITYLQLVFTNYGHTVLHSEIGNLYVAGDCCRRLCRYSRVWLTMVRSVMGLEVLLLD